MYLFCLPNAVSSGLGLKIILWIPVRIKDDHSVSCGQVDTETSGSGGEEEAEVLGPLSIEVVNGIFTFITTDRTIKPLQAQMHTMLHRMNYKLFVVSQSSQCRSSITNFDSIQTEICSHTDQSIHVHVIMVM